MESNQYARAFMRARKSHAHAVRQTLEAATDKARARHVRRQMNARRRMGEAQRYFEECALIELDV